MIKIWRVVKNLIDSALFFCYDTRVIDCIRLKSFIKYLKVGKNEKNIG